MAKTSTIREYISERLRTRFAVLVLGAAFSACALYFAMNYQMNRHQLARSLEMSRQVLTQALEAGDLNLATTYLRATIEQENFYTVELRDNGSGKSVLGPATSSKKRYLEICDSEDLGSKFGVGIYACRRLIGFREIGLWFVALLILAIVLAGGIRFINGELMDLSDRLSGVLDRMSQLGVERLEEIEKTEDDQEVAQVKEIFDLRRRIVEILVNSRELIEYAAAARIEAQVAHDIRSPLAALDSVLKDLSQLPEEKRVLMRSAVGRIRDIANNLVEKHRAATNAGNGPKCAVNEAASAPASAQLLSSLIDSLITEKRQQFRSQLGVEIDSRLDPASYGLFASIPPSEFKRVLSNLINNAVEALPGKGVVTVQLSPSGNGTEIRVHDNGKGIPPDALARLGQRGETHGKPGGSGLGLYHAKTSVESWGGRLTIDSEPGKGTSVTLHLPHAHPPEWFVSGLAIPPGTSIVVLDDDVSIHQVWKGRFESVHVKDHGVEVLHFSTPAELRAWARTDARTAKDPLYLMDYELVGYRETGLSLAEELGIGAHTILVTSRCEEKGVLADSLRLKVRLIPKSLAGFVPIQIQEEAAPGRLDAILIDDDALTRMMWKMSAEETGKKLRAFSSPAEFLREAEGFDRRTPVYIDAKLAGGVNGAEVSREIHALGFGEIYLATGHPQAMFESYTHLRGVVGKEPPWNSTPTPPPSSEEAA